MNCALFQDKFDYLGHTLIPGKLAAAIYTASAVFNSPFQKDKTKLRYFIVACNVYRRFI